MRKSNVFLFTSHLGIPMAARLVFTGDRYGLNGCLIHGDERYDTKEPLIEFYDCRSDFNKWMEFECQFVSRYYLSTFMNHEGGLCLDGGVPSWEISEANTLAVQSWVRRHMENTPYPLEEGDHEQQ